MDEYQHIPVLLDEVIEYLDPKPGEHIIDGTVGQGGHAQAILEHVLPAGRLLGIDRDPVNLGEAKKRLARFKNNIVLAQGSFGDMKKIAYVHEFNQVGGILLDLGFSSVHIEDRTRGFSFQAEGPLDMRYDRSQELTAAHIINGWNKDELTEIFRKFGEERHARKIADAIVHTRKREKILTTRQLVELVESVVPRRGRTHPATKVFQALRIAVNDELGELERLLPQTPDLLKPGGKLAVISFHSLEDRIVKRFLKDNEGTNFKIITKRVVTPKKEEVAVNPRARSAKLRVAERI